MAEGYVTHNGKNVDSELFSIISLQDFGFTVKPGDYFIEVVKSNGESGITVAMVGLHHGFHQGIQAIRGIKEQRPMVRILWIAEESQNLVKALNLGVDGFLLKKEINRLPLAVECLIKNQAYISSMVSPLLLSQFRQHCNGLKILTKLTRQEKETLLCYVIEGTRTKTARKLGVELPAIKSRIRKILRKTGMKCMKDVVDKYGKCLG